MKCMCGSSNLLAVSNLEARLAGFQCGDCKMTMWTTTIPEVKPSSIVSLQPTRAFQRIFGSGEDNSIAEFIARQKEFSEATFGPGPRTKGVTEHIAKELEEIRANPTDLMEWVDVILLALDGAWRAGHSPEDIHYAMERKLQRNKSRTWPDWRTAGDGAIQHIEEPHE